MRVIWKGFWKVAIILRINDRGEKEPLLVRVQGEYNAERRMTDSANHPFLRRFALPMKEDEPASEPIIRVTIWQPNSFTNPPQFAFSPKLNFLVLPRLAFITGRIALIFQNPLFFTTFFRNFAPKIVANLLCLGKKETKFLCFALDFS